MKKSFMKIVASFILGILAVSGATANNVEASPCSYPYCGVTVHVSDAKSFCDAVSAACEHTVIELDDDIYLDAPLNANILGSVIKNGHKIMCAYTVQHPGYYTVEPVITYQNVWHEGWTETKYCEVY